MRHKAQGSPGDALDFFDLVGVSWYLLEGGRKGGGLNNRPRIVDLGGLSAFLFFACKLDKKRL
jgi:hypothetical protein